MRPEGLHYSLSLSRTLPPLREVPIRHLCCGASWWMIACSPVQVFTWRHQLLRCSIVRHLACTRDNCSSSLLAHYQQLLPLPHTHTHTPAGRPRERFLETHFVNRRRFSVELPWRICRYDDGLRQDITYCTVCVKMRSFVCDILCAKSTNLNIN